ncbi:hypothetical protein MRB53_034887 [Persea americana]|uniref:Uncharacterized protein n=1 Tax=Persea americana TaxID=3435 RepID=A0ACC2K346_PERAE|nr:hypothetical protein MRB53_034887 [Persea americana]
MELLVAAVVAVVPTGRCKLRWLKTRTDGARGRLPSPSAAAVPSSDLRKEKATALHSGYGNQNKQRRGFLQQPPVQANGAYAQAQVTLQASSGAQAADGNNLETQLASSPGTEQADGSKNPAQLDPPSRLVLAQGTNPQEPAPVSIETHRNARDGAPTIAIFGEPGQLPTSPLDALVISADAREVLITIEATNVVNIEKEGDQGLSTASLLEVVDPKVSASADNSSMATLESNEGNPILSLRRDIIHNILEKIPAC